MTTDHRLATRELGLPDVASAQLSFSPQARRLDHPSAGDERVALKDQIALGLSLPQRSPDPIDVVVVRQVAQRAEALGFRDLWVTNNRLDPAGSLEALTLLTYAAALTSTIRVGVSVLVLPVYNPIHLAHQVATLDYLSGGRAVLGVGLGQEQQYAAFQIPREHRVRGSWSRWRS